MRIDYATPTYNLYGPEEYGWSYDDPFDYFTLQWDDERLGIKPRQLELALASVEHYYNKEVSEYKELRQYPPVTEQLDQIFHQGIDAWKADIQAIKDANPKQELNDDELQRRKQEVIDFLS